MVETFRNSIFDIDDNFIAIHSQYLYIDIAFTILLISYIIFAILHQNEFYNIINHRINPSSSIQGNRLHIKKWSFLWAKVIIIITSIVLGSQIVESNVEITSFAIGISICAIMIIRHIIISFIGFITGNRNFYRIINYVNSCQIVMLVYVLTPFVLLPYCIGKFYEIAYLIIVAYCIFHIFRTIKLLICNELSFFDVFLYLCTLEFLPIAMLLSLYKIFTGVSIGIN